MKLEEIKAHKKQFKDDILIGDNVWIKAIDISGRETTSVNIDEIIADIFPILESLEVHCVAGCCGFDAFDFTAKTIQERSKGFTHLKTTIGTMIDEVRALGCDIVVSSRMNNAADTRVMIALLKHIGDNII